MNCHRANSQENVTRLEPRICTGRPLSEALYHHSRLMLRFVGFDHIHTDPSRSYFTEADIIGSDFLRCLDRKSVTGWPIVDRKNLDADDFTFQIQNRSTRFAPLGGDVRPDKG